MQKDVNNVFDRRFYAGSHRFVKAWIQLGAPRTFSVTLRLDR